QRRGHRVHHRVGRLRGEHHRDEELDLVVVLEGDLRLRHRLLETFHDLLEPFRVRVYHPPPLWPKSSICGATPSPSPAPACARRCTTPKWAPTSSATTPPSTASRSGSPACSGRRRPSGRPPARWRTRSRSARMPARATR